jgi:hypothetical protein
MKTDLKFLFVVGSMLLFSTVSFSQFSLGVKGGLSIPNLSSGTNDPVSSGYSSREAPYFGVVAEKKLSHLITLHAELNYSSQGGKKDGVQAIPGSNFAEYFQAVQEPTPDYLYATYNSVAKLNYLELPVIADFNFPLGKTFSFFVGAGPYAGYLLNAKQVTSGSSLLYLDAAEMEPLPFPEPTNFDTTVSITSQIHKFNVGIQGGLGLSLNMKTSKFVLTAGGNYGFLNIQKNSEDGKNNTGAATVTLSYLIKL